jgi:hypothetical protein
LRLIYVARVGIFLITVALIAGMVGCGGGGVAGDGGESCTLTIDSTPGGIVAVDNATIPGKAMFTYDSDTVVGLIAAPSAGYRFAQWAGDVDTIGNVNAASITITMQGNYEVIAQFEAIGHSTYKVVWDIPEVIVASERTRIPVTLKTDKLGEIGYEGVQLHVKVYPRAGDVTIEVYYWSFKNGLYSGEFDLPAYYNETIYPLVYFSQPGQYTFTFSVIEAPYGPVIDNMTESIAVKVVEA